MFSLRQGIKIGGSHIGVSAALVPIHGSRARIGTCVLYRSLVSSYLLISHPLVSVLQPFTRLLSGDAVPILGTTDPPAHTPTRPIDALSHIITPRKRWAAPTTDAVVAVLRRSHRFRSVPSDRWICEFCQCRGTRVTS